MKDHIVEEVREVRARLAARFDYDVKAIMEEARKRQGQSGHDIVSYVAARKQKRKTA